MENVTSCQLSGKEWNGKPIYSIHLSDGRGGESFQQIAVGTSVNDLQIDQTQYGLRIKKKQSQNNFQGYQKRGGNESFALSYSKDLVVGGKVDIKQILPIAEKLYAWLEGKKPAAPAQSAASLEPKQEPWKLQGTVADQDLPF